MWISIIPSVAQTIIGSVPTGMTITNPNVYVEASATSESDTMSFDIDCDGTKDFRLYVKKSAAFADLPTVCLIYRLNADFELCSDSGISSIPKYYDSGDTLQCSGAQEWKSDFTNYLGNWGCGACYLPSVITDKYILYRKGGQEGWLKISFNIQATGLDTVTISATIDEVLTQCETTKVISNHQYFPKLIYYPNPVASNLTIESNTSGILCLLRVTGEQVFSRQIEGDIKINIESYDRGLYFLTYVTKEGEASTQKLILN